MSYKHLYVHVPFCRRRCSYCDFSIAVRREVPSERFVDVVLSELAFRVPHGAAQAAALETIYLGGGTPSLLSPPQLERLLDAMRLLSRTGSLDLTMEVNPDDVDVGAARVWRELGITRVSLGVQSLHAETLSWMHRTHTEYDALAALDALQRVGFDSISVDVIFGLPDQLDADPPRDVDRLVGHGASHVSAYGLTVEPATALAKWRAGGATVQSDEESYTRQFMAIHDRLIGHGFEHYEISNYARPGHRSAHNSGYWTGAPFLGIGPAAHSHLAGHRWWNVRPWAEYERVVVANGDPTAGRESLDDAQRRLEAVYLGLRTDVGVTGINARRLRAEDVDRLVESGHLTKNADGSVRSTLQGWLCLDEVATLLTTSGEGG